MNAYAPHSGYPVAAIDGFYADLTKALSKLPQRDTTIILGDFNAKIGQRRNNESFLGQWGRGRRNRNGHILASFCDANDLVITNTAFRKRARNITTWTLRHKDHCIFNRLHHLQPADEDIYAVTRNPGGALSHCWTTSSSRSTSTSAPYVD